MELRIIVAALAMCGSLAACDTETNIGFTRQEVQAPTGVTETTTISVGVKITNKGSANRFSASSIGSLNVEDIAIDITGHRTVVLDGFGTGTLLVKQGDTVMGSTAFTYAVADSMAVIANPSVVNAWLANYPSADGYDVELQDVPTVDTEEGVASLTVDTLYGTTVISTASTSWASGAGGGCNGPGGNDGNPPPDMPIELPGDGGICP